MPHDGGDLFEAIGSPWSPNLLPATSPAEVRVRAVQSFLDLDMPPEAESWLAEDEEERAKSVLVEKADRWLLEYFDEPAAWDLALDGG